MTDAEGLRGVVSTGTLWASEATALNDAREVSYGIDVAKTVLTKRTKMAIDSPYEKALLRYLRDVSLAPEGMRWKTSPFVISFCHKVTRSGQWLHYGRSGRGVAIGFDPRGLDLTGRPPENSFDLIRIDYSPKSQRARIESMIDEGRTFVDRVGETDNNITVTASYVAFFLGLVASHMKHPSFKEENELRLIGFEPLEGGKRFGANRSPTKFRMSNDRLIPYKALDFKPSSIKEVVIGYSSPLSQEAVRTFLAEHNVEARVTRSKVPVR